MRPPDDAQSARARDPEDVTIGRLAEIVAPHQEVTLIGDPLVPVTDLHHDSRRIEPGSAFVAVKGAASDGHDFIAAAISRGAVALIVEHQVQIDIPQLIVESTRPLMGLLAAEVHGHPSSSMTVIGVTGTNGKTTVTHMVESIAAAAGRRCGVIGTLGARIAGEVVPVGHTTPEATDLQRLLAAMRNAGMEMVAMEVSSHSLTYGRIDGVHFAIGAFTNLSQDHLDFHIDMDRYFAAKRLLFQPDRTDRAVVFTDDRRGAELAATMEIPLVTAGFQDADVTGLNLDLSPEGARFDVETNLSGVEGRHHIEMPIGAWFNVANALVAWGCAAMVGVSPDEIAAGLAALPTLSGRLEPVDVGQPFTVVVDYAHTPEAMARTIAALRPEPPARLIALGGAGGDRDRTKRPLMGEALAQADVAVVTSDNPRSEEPAAIVEAVAAGALGASERLNHQVVVEVDRRLAIRRALAEAKPGDVVMLLGKGHETGQEVAGVVSPFDDRLVAADELAALGHGGSGGAE